MKKLFFKFPAFCLLITLSLGSCKNETATTKVEDVSKASLIAEILKDKLTITSENIEKVENDFKIDHFAAAQKFVGKEVYVEAVCSGIPGENRVSYPELSLNLDPSFDFFTFSGENINDKLPTIETVLRDGSILILATDLKPSKNWQPLVTFTEGRTWGYTDDLFENDNDVYLIYDKKNDKIIYDKDLASEIALFIRANKTTMSSKVQIIEDVKGKLKYNRSEALYNDLMEGNFYYFTQKFNKERGNKNSTKGFTGEDELLPCKYLIKGTVSNDLLLENVVRLINSEVVKVEWLIDKKTFFSKQIKFDGKIVGDINVVDNSNTGNTKLNQNDNNAINNSSLGIANNDKVYFYSEPNVSTIRKAYIVKGQEVQIIEKDEDFYKVSFASQNGKTTEGYMKISDLDSRSL